MSCRRIRLPVSIQTNRRQIYILSRTNPNNVYNNRMVRIVGLTTTIPIGIQKKDVEKKR